MTKKIFFFFLFVISCSSLLEKTYFPSFYRLTNAKKIFANFKQDPIFQKEIDNLSYEQGKKYLDIIIQDYPDLISLFDRFRQIDATGNALLFEYGKYGSFSPTTLYYIKIAGDLRQRFNDLSHLHIVEIGKGCGTLCKILSDMGGFSSYTFVALPENNVLCKKFLEQFDIKNLFFIDKEKLSSSQEYDLVISNFAFSECDIEEQNRYLKQLISSKSSGYFTLNFISEQVDVKSLSAEELIAFLYSHGKKGKLEKEKFSLSPNTLLLTWSPSLDMSPSQHTKGRQKILPSHSKQPSNAVTYEFSGGRFGDNLLSYFHARWISYKYGLPLLYKPFPDSDKLVLSDMDSKISDGFSFEHSAVLHSPDEIHRSPASTLFRVNPWGPNPPFRTEDWDDPGFKAEAIECLTPKIPVKTIFLPKNCITVGVHVRKGGNFDSPSAWKIFPLKFPPTSFYINELRQISKIFKDQRLYVHIFTDDFHPNLIADEFKKAINDPNISIAFRYVNAKDFLDDFFSIPLFDCLIIPQSSFSLVQSYFNDFAILIIPSHATPDGNIDEVDLTFNSRHKTVVSQ